MRNQLMQEMLWALAGALAVGAASCFVWSLIWGVQVEMPPGREVIVPGEAVVSPVAPVEQFAHVWQTNIRYLSTKAVSTTNPTGMRSTLIATAVDTERPCAIFADEQQRPVVRSANEYIDGVKILAIERNRVILEDGAIELLVPDKYPGSPNYQGHHY